MPQVKSKATKAEKSKVETITVEIPLSGKPFTTFKDVIQAYHNLSGGDDFLSGICPLSRLEPADKLQLLVFLHRLAAWNARTELANLIEQVRKSLLS